MKRHAFLFLIIISAFLLSQCKKEPGGFSDGALTFSTDTVFFDTVFTELGSATFNFKIYNTDKHDLKITKISVLHGLLSNFRFNVDGISALELADVVIAAGDSIYVFVEVTLDPNGTNNPLVIEDQLLFEVNGVTQDVDLVAWGQDAIYYRADSYISGLPPYKLSKCPTDVWTSDKPYVIYDYLVVDENCTLTIQAGTRVHLHKGAGLWVYQGGRLVVNGTKAAPVTFQGDRLEEFYQDVSGQWDRIWINEGSVDNVLNYAIIKNAFIGIQAETLPFDPLIPISANTLKLNNCIIENCSALGLFSRNYRIEAENTLIANCGSYCFAASGGGIYDFTHCTFSNHWGGSVRQTPSVFLSNFYQDVNGDVQIRDITACNFKNSIIEGNIENEFDIEKYTSGDIFFNFDHSLVKTTYDTSNPAEFNNIVLNPSSSIFISTGEQDFHLTSDSPARNGGDVAIGALLPIDLDEISRTADTAPDMGAYEYAE